MSIKLSEKLPLYLLMLAPFFFYFGMLYLTTSIIVTAIILWQQERIINPLSSNNIPLLIISLFYLLCITSYFWSSDKNNWVTDSQVKLTLLLLPIFYFAGSTNKNRLQILLKYFFYASVSISIIQLIIFSYRYFIEGRIFYATIASYFSLFMHPSYMSMYLDFSLISGFLLTRKNILGRKMFLTGSLLIILNIFLAMSKIAFLVTTIIVFYIVLVHTSKLIRYFSIISILLLTLIGIYISPKFSEMVKSSAEYQQILKHPEKQKGSTAERILTWNASLKTFQNGTLKEKILGYGTGDEKSNLINFYKQHNYLSPFEKKLNSHNQFLEALNGTGILGFILLILSFILAFVNALKTNNNLLFWFVIISFFNFAVESMLNRQAGVLFFAFWFSVLNKYYPNNEKQFH